MSVKINKIIKEADDLFDEMTYQYETNEISIGELTSSAFIAALFADKTYEYIEKLAKKGANK